MENFSGQKFQWIKTNNPQLLGKVVTCRNIEPRGDRFMAQFDDGSSVDSAQLNTSLMMITNDMPPLTKAEVESIAGPRRPAPTPNPVSQPARPTNVNNPMQPVQSAPVVNVGPKSNMFDMFSSENSQITLSLLVKLPDKKLLRMMYTSAEDKEKFLDELSEYVSREINNSVIKDSISSMVAPQAPPRREKASQTITVNEIHET